MRILIYISLFILSSCVAVRTNDRLKTMEFNSQNGGFTIQVPSDWAYIEGQGIDSYVGAISTGQKDTFYFDFGFYSSPLDHRIYRGIGDENEDDSKFKTKTALIKIDGYNAKFASHWSKSKSDYGVHFDSLWTDTEKESRNQIKLTIYGFDISRKNRKKFEKVISSIKFNKP